MRRGVLRGNGLNGNVIFDTSNPANRDDCFLPYVNLRKCFFENGYDISTPDIFKSSIIDFELHQDVQDISRSDHNFLLMFETEFVKPENGNSKYWGRYKKIFTWRDDLVDGEKFLKINFPNPIHSYSPDGFISRDIFCCLIASNRSLVSSDERILYQARVDAIRWFECNAPEDFGLFGVDWGLPPAKNGKLGRLENRARRYLCKFSSKIPFPSYRGRVEHKRMVLTRARFAICFENVRDLPGYITEKIFDCFFSGCVPIYWGASNIGQYVPEDCFIDRKRFKDNLDVYQFLKKITEEQFLGYQIRINNFLKSRQAYPFSSEYFAETVVNTVVKDLVS